MKSVPSMMVFAAIVLTGHLVWSADTVVPRNQHPWGRFPVGSWKTVRVHTEVFDAQGQISSRTVTDTTTTLTAVSDTTYTLRMDVIFNVRGRRFASQQKTTTRGFNGETDGQTAILTKVGDAKLKVNEDEFACEIRRLEINGGSTRETSTVYYAPDLPPYILKRDTISTDVNGKHTNYETHVEVTGSGIPVMVLSETKLATKVKTINKRPNGITTTDEVHCLEVPGGVVSATSTVVDKDGKVVQRKRVELIDYDEGDGLIRVYKRRWFHHRKWFRKR